MLDMAVLRECLIPRLDALREANRPFGLSTTWHATDRLEDVLGKVIEARCELKRREHPDYNPAGDSECVSYATDEEIDRWGRDHPEKLEEVA
jgi:hypothetical protein